jgi:hypothetical protein
MMRVLNYSSTLKLEGMGALRHASGWKERVKEGAQGQDKRG